jgi:hypothetical protein
MEMAILVVIAHTIINHAAAIKTRTKSIDHISHILSASKEAFAKVSVLIQ